MSDVPLSTSRQTALAMFSMLAVVLTIVVFCLWEVCWRWWALRRQRRRQQRADTPPSETSSLYVAVGPSGTRLLTRHQLLQLSARRDKPAPPPYDSYQAPPSYSRTPPDVTTSTLDRTAHRLWMEAAERGAFCYRHSDTELSPPVYTSSTLTVDAEGQADRVPISSPPSYETVCRIDSVEERCCPCQRNLAAEGTFTLNTAPSAASYSHVIPLEPVLLSSVENPAELSQEVLSEDTLSDRRVRDQCSDESDTPERVTKIE